MREEDFSHEATPENTAELLEKGRQIQNEIINLIQGGKNLFNNVWESKIWFENIKRNSWIMEESDAQIRKRVLAEPMPKKLFRHFL